MPGPGSCSPTATLRVQPGDRIGLVGRNGAGKTTTLRVLAGEGEPYAGDGPANGPVGYLPQDPREGDLSVTAKDRVLSARGLDQLLREMEKAQTADGRAGRRRRAGRAVRGYGRIEERFSALGGYAAESEAARICANLGLPDRVLAQTDAARCPAASGAGSSWPGSCSPPPTAAAGRAERDHAAARRADEPPRRRLDHLAARLPAAPTTAASS